MKKKILAMVLCTIFVTAAACSNETPKTDTATESSSEALASDLEEHDHVHVPSTGETIEYDQFTVELTLPAEYIGDATQEQLTQTATELGYKSITLNGDGSATYIMTEEQHDTMLNDMANSLKQSIAAMSGSADYPSFYNVTVDDEFTKFMITTINKACTSEENHALMTLIGYSGIYHIFKGEAAESVRVDIINLDSNDIIYHYDSSEAQSQ